MPITLSNYIKAGSASENSQKYIRTDSTQAIKKDVSFVRKLATYNAAMKTYSIPEYRFTVRADVPDSDGFPSGQRATFDVVVRLPVMANEATLQEMRATVIELINSDDFVDSVVKQIFPCEATCN